MATSDEVYDRMPEEDRRGVVAWVLAQGRHLQKEDEWSMEDNFTTTEGTAEVYARYVLPHEEDDDVCSECGASLDDGQGYDGLCGNCADKSGKAECEHPDCDEWCDHPDKGHYLDDGINTWVPNSEGVKGT